MVYSEYKESALRHLQTCHFHLSRINTVYEVKEREMILLNTYYLCGYIIECIMSYTIYYLIKYNPDKEIEDLNNDHGCGIKYKTFFIQHKFNHKIDYIRRHGGTKVSNIPIIGNIDVDQTAKTMIDEWSTKVRYSSKSISFQVCSTNIKIFLNLADEIYKGLRKI